MIVYIKPAMIGNRHTSHMSFVEGQFRLTQYSITVEVTMADAFWLPLLSV